jgi:hypothetical protein
VPNAANPIPFFPRTPQPAPRMFFLDRIALFHVKSLNTLKLPPMPVIPALKLVPGQIFASVEKTSLFASLTIGMMEIVE